MKVLSQLSGGLDSVAVLNELTKNPSVDTIYPIFFDYGQPYAKQELQAALYATRFFQDRNPLTISTLLTVDLPLKVVSTTAVKEYVPLRNLALTAVSANYASSLNCTVIAVGSKSASWRPGDAYSFKDSTASFYAALEDSIAEATEPLEDVLRIDVPLLGWSKSKVVLELMRAGMDLRRLWSCYESGDKPCGKCYHCLEIEKAHHSPEVQAWMHSEVSS